MQCQDWPEKLLQMRRPRHNHILCLHSRSQFPVMPGSLVQTGCRCIWRRRKEWCEAEPSSIACVSLTHLPSHRHRRHPYHPATKKKKQHLVSKIPSYFQLLLVNFKQMILASALSIESVGHLPSWTTPWSSAQQYLWQKSHPPRKRIPTLCSLSHQLLWLVPIERRKHVLIAKKC